MLIEVVNKLLTMDNVSYLKALSKNEIDKYLVRHNLFLPESHVKLLCIVNGMSVYDGFYRLFGLDYDAEINLLSWNSSDLWKFAWNTTKVNDYLCFGETAWGDQYAYKKDEMNLHADPQIYLLDAITMEPEVISSNFTAFINEEIYPCAINPPYNNDIDALKMVGKLDLNEHLVYVPSILIGGNDDINDIQKLPSVSAMVINGDLCTQLAKEEQSRPIKEVKLYMDSQGRDRIRIIWDLQ